MSIKNNKKPIVAKPLENSKSITEKKQTSNWINNLYNNKLFTIGAIISFLLIALIYCKPIFDGKQLITSDGTASTAAVSDLDKYKELSKTEAITWTNAQFGGMPFYMKDSFNPNWLFKLNFFETNILGMKSYSFSLIFFLMLSMFILLNSLKINKLISYFFSIAFALTTFNMISIQVGHPTKILCVAFVLGMIAGIIEIANKNYIKGAILYSIFLASNINSNHVQIVYYSIFVVLFIITYNIIDTIIKKDFKHLYKSFLAIILPTLLIALMNISYLNMYYFGKETMRGGKKTVQTETTTTSNTKNKDAGLDKDYAFSWSYGITESMTYMIPNFMGGGNQNYLVQDQNSKTYNALVANGGDQANQLAQNTTAYWGEQPFVLGTYYYGIIIIALCLFFFIASKNRNKYWLLPVLLFFFFLSIGNNFQTFNYFLFDHLPMYNKFRAPSMAQSIVQIALFVAAALGLYKLSETQEDKKTLQNKFFIAFGFIAFLTILCIIFPTIFGTFTASKEAQLPAWLTDAMRADRIAILKKDAIRGLLYLAVAGSFCYLILIKKLNKDVGFAIVGLIAVMDLWNVDKRYFNDKDFKEPYTNISELIPASPVDLEILKDTDPHYRVYNLYGGDPFNDHNTSVYHQAIGGYSAAKLGKYQELIETHLSKMNYHVLDMLNTKYIKFQDQQTGQERMQKNENACGHAWFIDTLKTTNDDYEELQNLTNFNPKTTAFINKKLVNNLPLTYTKNTTDYIKLTKYLPHRMTYEYNAQTPQFAVFPDIYYMQEDKEGWYAKIDGQPIDIKQVNFILRGISLKPGKHIIEMEMIRDKTKQRSNISLICFGILNILWIVGLFLLYKKKKETTPTT